MVRRSIRVLGISLSLTVLSGCATLEQDSAAAIHGQTLVYIGTHGGKDPSDGIFAARLDETSGKLTALGLAAHVERPTWQVRDPARPILYSVSETGNSGETQGGVYSLAIDPKTGKLREIGRSDSGGGGATHLAYDAASKTLFVANFGGGQVSAIAVARDGGLAGVRSVQTDVGSGPHRRQKGPHAHGVTVDPTGRYVLAPDLGADKVFIYRFDPAAQRLSPSEAGAEQLPAGSGPRHLIFSPNGRFAFLDTELTGEVYVYRWDASAGRLVKLFRVAIDTPDFAGEKSAAEIEVSRDGRFLYVSNRGANTLIAYAIDPSTGALTEVDRVPAGGDIPWSFAITPSGRWLIVANEASNALAVFAVDPATGKLSATAQRLTVTKPVSLAFYPLKGQR